MGCIKLNILDEQYKKTEIKVSYRREKLTSNFCDVDAGKYLLHGQVISEYRQDWKLDTIPRYLFEGKEFDSESGLYQYENRYYDPTMCIFISPDPLYEQKPWLTFYHYCSNNPINRIDPTGLFDTESEAQQYQKDNNINGTIKQMGNSWLIIDKENNVAYSRDNTEGNVAGRGEDGVVKSVLCSADKTSNSSMAETSSHEGKTFSIDKAVAHLNAKAYPKYDKATCGNCASKVCLAIEAGGVKTSSNRPKSGSAKDYGASLEKWGFAPISNENYTPLKGDVRVMQNYPGESIHGHMDMHNGNRWVSDFLQNSFWSGPCYREHKPSYQIYRWK